MLQLEMSCAASRDHLHSDDLWERLKQWWHQLLFAFLEKAIYRIAFIPASQRIGGSPFPEVMIIAQQGITFIKVVAACLTL